MFKIAVLVSGGGTNLQAIINAVEGGTLENVEISIVISSNHGAAALERARKHGIKAITVCKADFEDSTQYEQQMIKLLHEENVELIVLAGFMTILSEKFTNVFRHKIINVHPSLIPSFCGVGSYGLRVHEAALQRGVKLSGATVHFVNPVADGGPIILQKAVEVMDYDLPETLQKRVMEQAEWELLPEAIKLISQNKIEVADGIVRRKL